jgi:hypothetical protein
MRFIVSRDYSPYGQISLISKLRLGIGAAVLIVATAAITATVMSRWNPFPPRDYEDCAARAATDAKSKDALSVLLSICSTEFKGRRKAGGGYTFYDRCRDRTVDIKGPNPTTDEQKDMREECLAYIDAQARVAAVDRESERKAEQAAQDARAREQQAAQDARAQAQQAEELARARLQARKMAVIPAIHVAVSDFTGCEFNMCTFMKVEVTNESKEALSGLTIGLSTIKTSRDACPSSYAKQEKLNIDLSPGERRGDLIDFVDIEFSKHPVCIKVLDVEFAASARNP